MAALVVIGLSGMEASAHVPSTCHVAEPDGTASMFLDGFVEAELADETDAYGHAVLGDAIEYRTIRLTGTRLADPAMAQGAPPRSAFAFTLPEGRVFEDVAARIVDPFPPSWEISGASPPAFLDTFAVVETDFARGAALAFYRITCDGIEKRATTPPIGTAYRWLAPAGIEDFDGDGHTDIAYVETPHLAGVLKVVSLVRGELRTIAIPLAGFSNHRSGEDYITSGVRLCRKRATPLTVEIPRARMTQSLQPELLVPSRDWRVLHAVRVENGALVVEDRPEPPTLEGIRIAQTCPSEELAQ